MISSKPSLRSGFDCIICPAPSGAGRTTPSQPGHYPLRIDQISTLLVLKEDDSRKTRSIPWLLMPWVILVLPEQQHPQYRLCRINSSLPSTRMDFNNLYHLSVEKSKEMHIQCSAVITWYNMSWYCKQYCNHSSKTSVRLWIHKRHSIPHPHRWDVGCLLLIILEKIVCSITASHCILMFLEINSAWQGLTHGSKWLMGAPNFNTKI